MLGLEALNPCPYILTYVEPPRGPDKGDILNNCNSFTKDNENDPK